jgi:hypothetical protein
VNHGCASDETCAEQSWETYSASQWQHRTFSCGVDDAILHKPTNTYCACTAVLPTITSKTPGEFLHFSSQTACIYLPWEWSYWVLLLAIVSNSGDVKTHLGRDRTLAACLPWSKGDTCPDILIQQNIWWVFLHFSPQTTCTYLSYSVSLLAVFISATLYYKTG